MITNYSHSLFPWGLDEECILHSTLVWKRRLEEEEERQDKTMVSGPIISLADCIVLLPECFVSDVYQIQNTNAWHGNVSSSGKYSPLHTWYWYYWWWAASQTCAQLRCQTILRKNRKNYECLPEVRVLDPNFISQTELINQTYCVTLHFSLYNTSILYILGKNSNFSRNFSTYSNGMAILENDNHQKWFFNDCHSPI